MMLVCISRASFLFRSWRRKLHEAGIVEIILSFNNDCDRKPNKLTLISKWLVMIVCSCSAEN